MWKRMTGERLFEVFQERILIKFRGDILRKAERVFDFLPQIKGSSLSEMRILNKWVTFFTNKGVPFLVVRDGKNRMLWKEELVSEKERIAAYGKTWRHNHQREK